MNNPNAPQSQTCQNERDWLDQALYSATPHELADDGFCQRVMQALPAQPQPPVLISRSSEQRLSRFSLLGGVLGLMIALLFGHWSGDVMTGIIAEPATAAGNAWLSALPVTTSTLAIVLLCTVLLWASLDES